MRRIKRAVASVQPSPVKRLWLPPVTVVQNVVASEKSALVTEALHVINLRRYEDRRLPGQVRRMSGVRRACDRSP